jgi:hypothetical protein
MQLINGEFPIVEATVRESLGATWMFPGFSRKLAWFLPCAHGPSNECGKDPPQTGGFSVSVAYSVGIHAVTYCRERQIGHDAASLEISSCGVFEKPALWLQMIDDFE